MINLNEIVVSIIRRAKSVAAEYGNATYSSAHLLNALLNKEAGLQPFIHNLGADVIYLKKWSQVRIEDYPKGNSAEIKADDSVQKVMEAADTIRMRLGLLQIDTICLLYALSTPNVGFSTDQLQTFPIREKDILSSLLQNTDVQKEITNGALDDAPTTSPINSYILKYCIDKIQLAKEKAIHPIIGRDRETRMILEVLGRYSRPNVILTGDAGVGKTAIVNGLACNIADGQMPFYPEGTNILELDTGALISGATYKGEVEERLSNIIKELRKMDGTILFIDDIHVLLDNKSGNSGAANILKQELSNGELVVIGATTTDEYRKLIEPDPAFSRRFEEIHVPEPDMRTAIQIVSGVHPQYVGHHGIQATEKALAACVTLAKRYIKDRKLPDSAIDLLDRTMSSVKMTNQYSRPIIEEFQTQLKDITKSSVSDNEKVHALSVLHTAIHNRLNPIILGLTTCEYDETKNDPAVLSKKVTSELKKIARLCEKEISYVDEEHIAAIIAAKTDIPIGKIQAGEKEKLVNLEETMRQRVVGQDTALKSLSDAIIESRSGMNRPNQPIGSFFLLGPTGTGKTESAKALAEVLFNDEKAIIRFDMSEFKEQHSAALLYGAPPGYIGYEEGGLLVNKIRRQPYAVVLFDEIEKAHPSVYDTFLQIMDEGKLHDRLGKEGDFSNAVVIFTSNVGSDRIAQCYETGKQPSENELLEVMGEYFRPEFLARLTEIIPFAPINDSMLLKIFNIQFQNLRKLLAVQGIDMEITDQARKMLAHKGFSPKYGARQVAGTIRTCLTKQIARLIIAEKISEGDTIKISMGKENELVWECKS